MEFPRPVANASWSGGRRSPSNSNLGSIVLTTQAFAQNIKTALQKYPAERRDDVVLLFSAHSLPSEIVK